MCIFDLHFIPLAPLCNSEAVSCLNAAAGEPPDQQAGMLVIVSAYKIFEPLTVWAHAKNHITNPVDEHSIPPTYAGGLSATIMNTIKYYTKNPTSWYLKCYIYTSYTSPFIFFLNIISKNADCLNTCDI